MKSEAHVVFSLSLNQLWWLVDQQSRTEMTLEIKPQKVIQLLHYCLGTLVFKNITSSKQLPLAPLPPPPPPTHILGRCKLSFVLLRTLKLSYRPHAPDLAISQWPPSPNLITVGIQVSTYSLWGGTNIQPTSSASEVVRWMNNDDFVYLPKFTGLIFSLLFHWLKSSYF